MWQNIYNIIYNIIKGKLIGERDGAGFLYPTAQKGGDLLNLFVGTDKKEFLPGGILRNVFFLCIIVLSKQTIELPDDVHRKAT